MTLLIIVGLPLITMMIRFAVSRVREYEADRGGAEIHFWVDSKNCFQLIHLQKNEYAD
jgi:Zn-dependent protease with chaperone function